MTKQQIIITVVIILILIFIAIAVYFIQNNNKNMQTNTSTQVSTQGITLEDAQAMVQSWGRDSRDMSSISSMEVDASGGFLTRASGAFFRYEPAKSRLLVSGLIGYNDTLHKKYTDTWEKLIRAGDNEQVTLGEGQFELYRKQLFHLEPDVILLTKVYSNKAVDPKQFATEVRWLLSAANYWLMKRYSEVLVTPESILVEQAPGINARWPKRPW